MAEDRMSRMPEHDEESESEQEELAEGGPEIEIPTEEIEGSENWKDGETYEISMTVRQVSKGKFEILEAEEEEPEEEPEEKGTEEGTEEKGAEGEGYK